MSDVQVAGEEALPTITNVEVGGEGALSPRDAANALAQNRYKRDKAEEPIKDTAQAEPAAPATDTGEQPTETSEQQPAEDAAPAPLELPRSWSKDQSERWASLPPETQQYLLDQDSKATKAVRQAQNEAAEQRKAIEADRTAMEQARKQYDEALPMLLQTLHQQQMGEFSDIKTMADVEKLAREDWPRYALWDAQQKKMQAVQQELKASQDRQQQDFRGKWDTFAKDEDNKFSEIAGEIPEKMRAGSVAMLKDYGFSDSDLSRTWNGEASWSPRDHRVQLLIRDAYRYREAQTGAKTKAIRPVPTVQRPGSPAQRAPDADIHIRNLDKQFDNKPNWKNAAELLIAQRARRQ